MQIRSGWMRHRMGIRLESSSEFGSRPVIGPFKLSDADVCRAECRMERFAPVETATRCAAEDVDAGGAVFGKRMDGEMRFLKKPDSGSATAVFKHVPDGIAYRPKLHALHDVFEESGQVSTVRQPRFLAPKCLDEPLNPIHGTYIRV